MTLNSIHSVTIFAPATVANVACGFDIFGFALERPGDYVTVRKRKDNHLSIVEITGDQGRLSRHPKENTVAVAIEGLLNHLGVQQGVDIWLRKEMPLGSGLGSSAASAVAGIVAVNRLLGSPLPQHALLPFAMEAERIACGAAHADNVAPSLLGGFVLIRSYDPLDVISLPYPERLTAVVIHPHLEINTKDARSILRNNVLMSDAIKQWGNVAGVVAGLMSNDTALLARSLKDEIVEPLRAILIPNFHAVQRAALDNGALGCSISGSGPSVFALLSGSENAKTVAEAMQAEFVAVGITSQAFISPINSKGPQEVEIGS